MAKLIYAFAAAFIVCASSAHAQSFFLNLGTDPSTGVDRGSASVVRKVDTRTGFLTFSTIGAEEIGPYIASATLAWPDLMLEGDQLDLVFVMAGPSDDGGRELAAFGTSYRYALPLTDLTVYANADRGDFNLGSDQSLALDIKGEQTNAALGVRKVWSLAGAARLTGTFEVALRDSTSEVLGTQVTNESLRLLRTALRHESGFPFSLQQRYAVSLTKGFDGFGASATTNPLASAPGVTTNFVKLAFSAEASVPLSARFLINVGVVGQWTNDSLPVSQRCGYGTNNYARGFDQSYVNGDRCLGTRVEVAYHVTSPKMTATEIDLGQAFLGLDGGSITDVANDFLAQSDDVWSSVSMGYRMAKGSFVGEIAFTHIFDKPTGAFAQDDSRIWAQVAYKF
jgi:hemolysin activation/secretion protein